LRHIHQVYYIIFSVDSGSVSLLAPGTSSAKLGFLLLVKHFLLPFNFIQSQFKESFVDDQVLSFFQVLHIVFFLERQGQESLGISCLLLY